MNLNSPLAQLALRIAERLHKAGFTAYLAGGCVRDAVMGKEAQDYDIATSAKPEEVESLFSKTVPVGKQFGVILVIEEGKEFEVATFRKEGGYKDGRHPTEVKFTAPGEDAQRRDFTINGLFYDPAAGKVLDYVGGQADIPKKVIRAIGKAEERFDEDKLRLLRAIRFASSLGFEIEDATWQAIKKKAPLINQVSPERIRDEIVKMLTRPGASRGLELLSSSGLGKEILPEIEAMKGVEQQPDYHPEGDVFIHTRLLLEKLNNPTPTLALGALFHDVGKPPSFAVRNGKITFYEHEFVGARMTEDIMRRLKFSNDEINSVKECVVNHMKFGNVQQMRSGKLKQFVSRPNFLTELELHRIDCLSSHGKLDNYEFLKQKLKEYEKEELRPKPLVNGHDLIALGLEAGPEMKPLLEEIYVLQLEGAFKNKDEALAWVRKKTQK